MKQVLSPGSNHYLLPRLLMITGSDPKDQENFLSKLNTHLHNGVKLIQLRAKELSAHEYVELAKKAVALTHNAGAQIILNTDIPMGTLLGADGVHLTSQLLLQQKERPLPENKIISAACHNRAELHHAEKIKADFVILSPVQHTQTHVEKNPLGWNTFTELCRSARVPVYALGGLSERDLTKVLACGGYGVAALSALWDRNY